MAEHDGFIRAILDDPEDDLPRLVYADWLEERGDPRGELIRLQCELERIGGSPTDPAAAAHREALSDRLRELLRKHGPEWAAPLERFGRLAQFQPPRRGFVEAAYLAAETLLTRAGEVFQVTPLLREVAVDRVAGHLAALAQAPSLARLTSLRFLGGVDAEGARALACSPHLGRLIRLDFGRDPPVHGRHTEWDNEVGDRGAEALAASASLRQLTDLGLGFNRIGDAGARALADSPHRAGLTWLDLGENEIGEAGVQALIDSPHLTRLTRLGLRNNPGAGVPCYYYDDMGTVVASEIDRAAADRLRARFQREIDIF
jgi:uncharacterized protein (TIGR02996 family)